MMSDEEYVLCKWKKRRWPAQILSRSRTSRGRTVPKEKLSSIRVRIIAENKQVTVHCDHIVPATIQSIEAIANKLGPSKETSKVVEELTYRCALREVLEKLKEEAAHRGPGSLRQSSGEASTREGQQERSSAPQQGLSPQRSPRGTKRMAKAGQAPPGSPATLSGPLGSGTESPSARKPPSSASGGLPSGREPAWQSHRDLNAPKPNISEELTSPSQHFQRSPRASKGHRQVGGPASEEAPLAQPARTSTPASTSRKRCPRFPPAKGRARAAPRLRRNLLAPLAEGFSSLPTDALPAEQEAPQPRRRPKTSSGTRCSPHLQEQTLAAGGPSLKRPRCMSHGGHGDSSPEGAPWGPKGGPSPDRAGEGGHCQTLDVTDEGRMASTCKRLAGGILNFGETCRWCWSSCAAFNCGDLALVWHGMQCDLTAVGAS
ncbi:PWWP domain-containing DNA repair factor 3A-like [Candoia aspera]|uniref:PWWP domain-containing DNA repair factor 3A-like n=1 Tax=Candoia aspera TaxID=51853 RepID=UPI002FD86E41